MELEANTSWLRDIRDPELIRELAAKALVALNEGDIAVPRGGGRYAARYLLDLHFRTWPQTENAEPPSLDERAALTRTALVEGVLDGTLEGAVQASICEQAISRADQGLESLYNGTL